MTKRKLTPTQITLKLLRRDMLRAIEDSRQDIAAFSIRFEKLGMELALIRQAMEYLKPTQEQQPNAD